MLTTTHHFTALARNSTVQQLKRSVSTTTGLIPNTRNSSFARPARLARAIPPQRFFSSTSRINMPPLPIQKAEEVGE